MFKFTIATLYRGKLVAHANFDHTFERSETKLHSSDCHHESSLSIYIMLILRCLQRSFEPLVCESKQELASLVRLLSWQKYKCDFTHKQISGEVRARSMLMDEQTHSKAKKWIRIAVEVARRPTLGSELERKCKHRMDGRA